MSRFGFLALALASAGVAAPVLAHHSFAEYDDKTRVTITGTLMTLEFTNPHIQMTMQVRNKAGQPETWKVSGPAPSAWRESGWVKSDFVIGKQMTLIGFPKRDDAHHLSVNVLKSSTGKTYGTELNLNSGYDGAAKK